MQTSLGVDKSNHAALNRAVPTGLLVLYASASGNAEQLALAAAESLGAEGHATTVHNVADFPAGRLREWDVALLVVSTWGEGRPPPEAEEFCAALAAPESLGLTGLRYAVLALGSSMYADFCACGRQVDADLARHGATRLVARVECDTKFKADYERWLAAVRDVLEKSA